MKRFAPALVVAVLCIVLLSVSQAAGRSSGGDRPPGGPAGSDPLGPGVVTVDLTVRYSHFSPDRVDVVPGTTVRFVIHNDDPINHEFIVGDDEVHRRHESGTEASHPPVPGEVSVPAESVAETTFEFAETGSVLFACHLPGHFAYGMQGHVVVTPTVTR